AENRYPRLEALLADIALGNRMPAQVARVLAAEQPGVATDLPERGEKILITGHERGVISFANCCMPIPGDEIMGSHTTGKGIGVDRKSTRLNSSHVKISYAVFCLKKKTR